MSKKGKEWRARRKLRDPVGWRLKQREKKKRYFARHPEKLENKKKQANVRAFNKLRRVPYLQDTYGDEPALVYALQVGKFVKIGITADLMRRVEAVITNCPYEFKVIYQSQKIPRFEARKIETLTHSYFLSCRVHGEWFEIGPDEVVDFLTSLSTQALAHSPPVEHPQLKLVI